MDFILPKFQFMLPEIIAFVKDRFSLDEDKASEAEIVQSIRKGIEFRGINVWILIFAIFIASIGLNVNSTAVIIGAMLISPLMGPIMGIGLGVGINDFELIKRAAKNLSVMVGISVVTSTTYFFISPLSDAQSELLARTTPTTWDVFIAFFGGLAGIVAGASKEKGNAIPGVAIATALMPPLCTAGFGIANGDFYFFAGAFYLFFINAVFISVSTFLIVRFLGFSPKEFMDRKAERRVKNYISILVIVTVLPSIYIAYNIVQQTLFEKNINLVLQDKFNINNTQIAKHLVSYDGDRRNVEVFLIGEPLADSTIDRIRYEIRQARLGDVELVVKQGLSAPDMNQLRSSLLQDLYRNNEEALKSRDQQIRLLETELTRYKAQQAPVADLAEELEVLYPGFKTFSLHRSARFDTEKQAFDSIWIAQARVKNPELKQKKAHLERWLKARVKADSLELYFIP